MLTPPNRGLNSAYDRSVFINCPFDNDYASLFRALVFAVLRCGLVPRCALEVYDGGEVRIEKIVRIIRACKWGIHDISRTELSPEGLPRFNMPLELGIFIGAIRFGDSVQSRKSCLILDRAKFRYQAFMSDIAGQDIAAHDDRTESAIAAVRDWLAVSRSARFRPPSASVIAGQFERFSTQLPVVCDAIALDANKLTFVEYSGIAARWLKRDVSRNPVAS